MTVLDSSFVFDLLVGGDPPQYSDEAWDEGSEAAAPDVLVFEVVSALRRHALAGSITHARAKAAVDDLGDLAVELFPAMVLRKRAWELRANMTVGDGLFVALAELLDEPLVTRDARLAKAARLHTTISVIEA